MSDYIKERMRTLAVKPDYGAGDEIDQLLSREYQPDPAEEIARDFVLFKARIAAEERLHSAALVVGKHFHDETDASWGDVHEYEAAALDLYKAVRAEQEGT